jgi:hypothetical protein
MNTMAIDPMQGKFLYVIHDGENIVERGRSFDTESLMRIAKDCDANEVRICCGWNADEILRYCHVYRWTPCKLYAGERTELPNHPTILFMRDARETRDASIFCDAEYMAAYSA